VPSLANNFSVLFCDSDTFSSSSTWLLILDFPDSRRPESTFSKFFCSGLPGAGIISLIFSFGCGEKLSTVFSTT
jgi:hypothetical protein